MIRKNLIEKNTEIIEENIPFDFIESCDELFISSSSKEILPITRIDDTIIGNGQVGKIYKELYHQF